jgi:predicted nucleic acid-binding protein
LTRFVLDNSVSMRWCFQNATHPYADGVLETLASGEALVPVLWRYEVTAVLAKAQRDGILTAAKADAFLVVLQSLNIKVDRDSADHILDDVYRLAVAYRLTSYDAAYLELARRTSLPLATLDDELIRACKLTGHARL